MPVLVVCLLIVLVSLIGGAVYGINKLIPTSKQMDLTEYYGQNADGEASLVAGTQKLEQKALISGDEVYIPLDVVNGYLNQRYYWDSANKKILYATPTSLTEEAASDQPGGNVWLKESTVYLKLDYVKKYTDIDSYIYKDPARIAIQYKFSNVQTVTVKKDTVIRYRGGIKSKILTKTAKDTVLRLMNEGEDWDQVATDDGYIGYIQKKKVSAADTTDYKRSFKAEAYSYFTMDEPVNLAWHQVTSTDANNYFADTTQNMTGVNVISPTWFYLNDNNGNIANLASLNYVNYCHNQGIEVWALVSNLENKNVDTTEVLTHTSKRQNLVNQIVSMAIQYNLDGINVDFESMNGEKVGDAFIEFIRELSIKCKNNGVVLSVDNYVPMSHTSFYNRKEQANFADYVVIMGYDEHYAGSPEAGSVASLSWVTQGVSDTLKEVPADQVILGMPFYTRVWEIPSESSSDDTTAGAKIPSKIYGMKAANDFLATHGATKTWQDDCGQNYSEFTDNDTTYKVWLEDSASAECRLKLVEEKKLAGASFWKLGFETSDIWDTVTRYIH